MNIRMTKLMVTLNAPNEWGRLPKAGKGWGISAPYMNRFSGEFCASINGTCGTSLIPVGILAKVLVLVLTHSSGKKKLMH